MGTRRPRLGTGDRSHQFGKGKKTSPAGFVSSLGEKTPRNNLSKIHSSGPTEGCATESWAGTEKKGKIDLKGGVISEFLVKWGSGWNDSARWRG